MKSTKLQALSLRAKFKGSYVEVVIINHDTGEIQVEQFPCHFLTPVITRYHGKGKTSDLQDVDAIVSEEGGDDHECSK